MLRQQIKRLQNDNLELRSELKALNTRIDQVLGRPFKHQQVVSSETALSRQTSMAEKQLKACQLEYQKTKSRYTKLVEVDYVDALTAEVDFKQQRIRDLETTFKTHTANQRNRENTMDKLLVQGDVPDMQRKVLELTAELQMLTAKAEDIRNEASRRQKVLETLKATEEVLVKKVSELQQQTPTVVEQDKLRPVQFELSKCLEVLTHSIQSQERNFKRRQGLLVKELESTLGRLAEMRSSLKEKTEELEEVSREIKEARGPKLGDTRHLSTMKNRSYGELLPRKEKLADRLNRSRVSESKGTLPPLKRS
jgi:DNA repair exonuclease SbcCD ATPase subunit